MPHFDLAHRLTLYGYTGDIEDFDRTLGKLWCATVKDTMAITSVETLLQHPMLARCFCDDVRREANIWVEDDEILLRLTNLRKNNYLSTFDGKN